MADNITEINKNKKATPGKLYYDKEGNEYTGTTNKRLVLTKRNYGSNKDNTSTTSEFSKVFRYNTTGDIIQIEYLYLNKPHHTAAFTYSSSGDVLSIRYNGKYNYSKQFSYDSNGNITNINILNNV